jgi:hypothetical protein
MDAAAQYGSYLKGGHGPASIDSSSLCLVQFQVISVFTFVVD